jgi:hypothetical protein
MRDRGIVAGMLSMTRLGGRHHQLGDLIRLPGETEDELHKINSEISAFGQEIIDQTAGDTKEAVLARLRALGWDDAKAIAFDRGRGVRSLDELAEQIAKNTPNRGLTTAQSALVDAVNRFENDWRTFYRDHVDIPWQNWPGSGAWEHAQQFLDQLTQLRAAAKSAGFKVVSQPPHEPHHDTGVGDWFAELGKYAKWIGLGAVGLVGLTFSVVAVKRFAQRRRAGSFGRRR